MKIPLIGLLGALVLMESASAASVIVARYQMGELEHNGGAGTPNGGSAATLLGGPGANMTAAGAPVLVVGTGASNAFGSAAGSTAYMSFDGVLQHYDVSPNLLASSPSAWMMEAWVRPAAGDSGLGLILSNGHGGTGVVLNYNAATGKYGIFFGGDASSPRDGSISATGVGVAWDHVALVYESNVMTLYVNGTSAWTGSKLGTAGYANGSAIGSQYTGGGDHGFKGDIDDVYFSTVSGFNAATDLHGVPEPSVALLGGLGLLSLLRRRRC